MAASSEKRPLSDKDSENQALTFFENGEASELNPDNLRRRFQDIKDVDRYEVDRPEPWVEIYNQWNVKQKFHRDEAIVRAGTPKQSRSKYKQLHSRYRRLGYCSNVWQFGEVIWLIRTKEKSSEFRDRYYSKKVSGEKFVEEFREKANCSEDLMSLVMRCLEPIPDHRPTSQHVVRDAIDGLRQHEPKCAEAAEKACLKPRSDRLLRKAKSRPWDAVLSALRHIYIEDGIVRFAEWYEKHNGRIKDQQSAEPIPQIEIDNGEPDPVADDAPNNEISVFRAVPSTVPNDNARQLSVDDVLGPTLPREIPRPRVPLLRDNTEDGRMGGGQSSSPAVAQRYDQACPSPIIHVIVNVHPWCAGVGVDGISALPLDFYLRAHALAQYVVEDLHALVVEKANQSGRQRILDSHLMYKYAIADDDDPLSDGEVLGDGDVLGDLLQPGQRRLVVNLNLKYSLPLEESVMWLDFVKLVVECRVTSSNHRWDALSPLEIDREDMTTFTIKKLTRTIADLTDSLPNLPSFIPSKARVKLRDQSNQYIYDGRANAQGNHGNQLVASYCIAGEFEKTREGTVATLRLDIEVQPTSGVGGRPTHPNTTVADNFLFIVRVRVKVHRGRTLEYGFACRRGTQLRQLRAQLIAATKNIGGSRRTDMVFRVRRGLSTPETVLREYLPQNGPACVKIEVDFVPPIKLLFWPQDTPSQACPRNDVGFWRIWPDKDTTVGDLKLHVRDMRAEQIQRRDNDLTPAMRRLVDQWAVEGPYDEIDIRVSGPADAIWRGFSPPLTDDLLVADTDFFHCIGGNPSRNVEMERRLDVLFRRSEGNEIPPRRSRLHRRIVVPDRNNSLNLQPLTGSGTLTARRPLEEGISGSTSSPGSVLSNPTPLPPPRTPTPRSPSPLIPLQERTPSPVQSPPPRVPTPQTPVVQSRPSEVSDPGVMEDEWFSDGSIDEDARSKVKVRCFRKGQRSITYRSAKKDVNGEDKTTNTLRAEIIARGFYRPNIMAPMIRIRRPDLDQDLGDNEPLSKSLPGGMRQLICIAGDWEKGFPSVPPELEEPVQEPLREPVEDKPPPRQEEEQPVVPEPLPEEYGDSEADFSDRSQQPEGPKKKDLKIRCICEGYRPCTFRTYKDHKDANKHKNIAHVTREIIESGIYGPENNGYKLETSDLILHEKRVMGSEDKRIPSNTSIKTCLQTRGKSLWCRMKPYIARRRALFDAGSGSFEDEDETFNTRRPGDETAWFTDNSDNDDAEVLVRCFCKGKASQPFVSTKGQNTATVLKREIIAGLDGFYPAETEPKDLELHDPTLPVGHPERILSPGRTLRKQLVPPKRILYCIRINSDLQPDPFQPGGKVKDPKDKPDKSGSGKTGNGTTRKRLPEPNKDGNSEEGGSQAPAQKKTKTRKSGKCGTGGGKKTPAKKTTASNGKTENSTTRKRESPAPDDDGNDEDVATQRPAQKKTKTRKNGKSGTGRGKKPSAKKTTAANGKTGNSTTRKRKSPAPDDDGNDEDGVTQAPVQKKAKFGKSGKSGMGRRKKNSANEATDSNGDEKNTDADDEDEDKDGEVRGPRIGTKRKRTLKK